MLPETADYDACVAEAIAQEAKRREVNERLTAMEAGLAADKAAAAAANEALAQETAARQRAETDLADARATAKAATAEITAANERAAADRSARIKDVIDRAVAQGVVIQGRREIWERKFQADFAGALVEISNERPFMGREAITRGLAPRRPGSDAVTLFANAVNERARQIGDHTAAWLQIRRERKDLWAATGWQ
jgi:hypothetical protein